MIKIDFKEKGKDFDKYFKGQLGPYDVLVENYLSHYLIRINFKRGQIIIRKVFMKEVPTDFKSIEGNVLEEYSLHLASILVEKDLDERILDIKNKLTELERIFNV